MTYLADVNVMIALSWPNHVHHAVASAWFRSLAGDRFATCPLTEVAFVRLSMNPAVVGYVMPYETITQALEMYRTHPKHDFWPDRADFLSATRGCRLSGHRQVTDAYLIGLATSRRGALVTFDAAVRSLIAALPNGEPSSVVVLE
ncbi:MAG: type II toxin-antitoxin system VapC family toxin [Spirochaetaceae bacterium]|nr:MAG: type II toxin-antitoxin system VapC family toxin [Spirochaetaceae bacterium]